MQTRPVVMTAILMAAMFALPLSALDPNLLKLAGPEARILAGLNIDQAKVSPLGQYVLSQIKPDEAGLRSLMESTGFDPRRDLREVMLAGVSGAKSHTGLIIASGVFDAPRITQLARNAGAGVETYAGVEVLISKEANSGCLAFLNGTTAVAGDPASVRAALDRRAGGPGPDRKLLALATDLASRNDLWFVTVGSPAELASRVPDPNVGGALKGDAVQAISQLSGGVKLGATVLISAEAITRSDKDATALADVVRFFAGMVQLNREKQGAATVAGWLDTMELKTEANTARLSLAIPHSELEQLLKSGHPRHARPRRTAD